jgi:penicillin-binding protein 1C
LCALHRGAEAASRWYFDKAARDLSLGEAAALASIPRGPTLYDARKEPERLVRRRDRVLDRMLDAGLANPEEVRLAKAEPIVTTTRTRVASAPHLVAVLERGELDPCGPPVPIPTDAARVTTTLIASLQAEIEQAARRRRQRQRQEAPQLTTHRRRAPRRRHSVWIRKNPI